MDKDLWSVSRAETTKESVKGKPNLQPTVTEKTEGLAMDSFWGEDPVRDPGSPYSLLELSTRCVT